MNSSTQPTGLIRPFNLDPHEYDAMYNGPLPDELRMVIIESGVIHNDFLGVGINWQLFQADLMEDMKQCKELLVPGPDGTPLPVLDPRAFGLQCKITPHVVHGDANNCVRVPTGGGTVYCPDSVLQVGFLARHHEAHIVPGNSLTYAMSIWDYLFCETNSAESADHHDVEVPADEAEAFRLVVGDSFREGWGFMNRQLVEYRNLAIVLAGAVNSSTDLCETYRRYLDKGKPYYLDYFEDGDRQTESGGPL